MRGRGSRARHARRSAAGDAFVALQGGSAHGLEYLPQARRARRARGAVGTGGGRERRRRVPRSPYRRGAASCATASARIADRFYGSPSSRADGRRRRPAPTARRPAQLLAQAVGAPRATRRLPRHARRRLSAGASRAATLTTPDVMSCTGSCARLARCRRDARRDGSLLARARPGPRRRRALRVAAFTNLTRDHLDYHGTMDATARRRRGCSAARRSSMRSSTSATRRAPLRARRCRGRRADRGRGRRRRARGARACARRRAIGRRTRGLELDVDGHFGRAALRSRAARRVQRREPRSSRSACCSAWDFGVDEALAALAACERAARAHGDATGAPNGALAVVDYAHTPDALGKALPRAARARARPPDRSCSAAAAIAIPASARDGRGGRAARRPRHRHRRQPAQRGCRRASSR